MERFGTRYLAMATLALGVFGCSGGGIADPPRVDPGITVGGLNFVVVGAGYSTATGALPAADPDVAAPVVTLSGPLEGSAPAQIVVSAAEPFQTVLLLPVGWTSYARVAMPGNTTLIGVTTKRSTTDSFAPARVQVAIVRGGKVSAPTFVTLLTPIT